MNVWTHARTHARTDVVQSVSQSRGWIVGVAATGIYIPYYAWVVGHLYTPVIGTNKPWTDVYGV